MKVIRFKTSGASGRVEDVDLPSRRARRRQGASARAADDAVAGGTRGRAVIDAA